MLPRIHTPYPLQWVGGLFSVIAPIFIKKNPNIVVLTSFHGDGYRGNTKILFEELLHHPTLKPVWLTRNKKVFSLISQKFGKENVCYTHSPMGLYRFAQASALLFTHGTSDFPYLRLPRRALRIQTYHGMPTKRGEYLRPGSDKPPNRLHTLILKYRFNPITHFLSTSPAVTKLFSSRFNIPEHKFITTGFPSSDPIISAQKQKHKLRELFPHAPTAQNYILYAPTYRKRSKTKWFPFFDVDLKDIASFLEQEQALLIFRPHPNEKLHFESFQSISEHFVFAGHKVVEDVNQLLIHSDVIITDYSSIYIEGLLRNIPCIFLPYDQQRYERGLIMPYEIMTPGPKVFSQEEFKIAIQKSLNDPFFYKNEREQVKKLFYSGTGDGQATQRVIQFLEKNLLQD